MAIVSPRASVRAYDDVPFDWTDEKEHRRMLARAINELRLGKIRARGSFTLTQSQATTTLTDANIGPDSLISWHPTTSNAAAEIGNGTLYVSAQDDGTATLTHANNAQTDRTFRYAVFG